MNNWPLFPPIAFGIVLLVVLAQLRGMRLLSSRTKASQAEGGKRKAYACGEDVKDHRIQPDYDHFFHFAAFFTIMHVLALVVATVPSRDIGAMSIACGYLLCCAVGVSILFRR